MPIKINRWACQICGEVYDELEETRECESQGITSPLFKIGDRVKYQLHMGHDEADECQFKIVQGIITAIVLPTRGELNHLRSLRYVINRKLKIFQDDILDERINDIVINDSRKYQVNSWKRFCETLVSRNPHCKAAAGKLLDEVRKRDKDIA